MSIRVKLHPGEFFKDNHLNIVLVLQNLLFGESNDVSSIISFAFLKFTIDESNLTNHTKFQTLKLKIIIKVGITIRLMIYN